MVLFKRRSFNTDRLANGDNAAANGGMVGGLSSLSFLNLVMVMQQSITAPLIRYGRRKYFTRDHGPIASSPKNQKSSNWIIWKSVITHEIQHTSTLVCPACFKKNFDISFRRFIHDQESQLMALSAFAVIAAIPVSISIATAGLFVLVQHQVNAHLPVQRGFQHGQGRA